MEEVSEFIYLGSLISNNGICKAQIRQKIRKASTVTGRLCKIWTDKNISLNTNPRLYHFYADSTMSVTEKKTMRTRSNTVAQKKVRASLQLCQILTDFQNFPLLQSAWNLLQKPYDTTQLTLGMLLHYLEKLQIQIFCRYCDFPCTDEYRFPWYLMDRAVGLRLVLLTQDNNT